MTLKKNAMRISSLFLAVSSAYALAGAPITTTPIKITSNQATHNNGQKAEFSPSVGAKAARNASQSAGQKFKGLNGEICGTDTNAQDWHKLQVENKKQLLSAKSKKQSGQSTSYSSDKGVKLAGKSANTANAAATGDGAPGRYYIPVVVHVYGAEYNCEDENSMCLTEAKIIEGLNQSTEDFRGLNNFDGPILAEFQAIRGNLDIEFVLAKKDPDGNPTNGIVRYETGSGYGHWADYNDDIAADSWDNFKYLNIYLQNDLYANGSTNNSGVAWYPEMGMSEAGLARVVYNGNYFGVNTDENFRSVLTHEFGHWFNLPHTFEGSSCSIHQEAFCSATGDNNCDTPQMGNSSVQNNLPNCLGQATNTENFMHYTDNYAMYTQGQVSRMTAALHGPARANLWSHDNLVATGLEEFTSNAEHVWDGTGADYVPQGDILAEYTDLSANLGEVDNYEITIPQGTEAVAFYLDGFTEDPDLYVSKGTAPVKNGDTWVSDFISFQATGVPELVSIASPTPNQSYFAAIDAFSAYSNAKFSIIAIDDESLCEGCERIFLADEIMTGVKGEAQKNFQFEIPSDAIKTIVVMPGQYSGDPDLHVAINTPATLETYDCRPYMAANLSEFCDLGASARGNTVHVMINAFDNYTAPFQVYYERQINVELPLAEANGGYYGLLGDATVFSSAGSVDFNGTVESYYWDFGDGNNSTEANPTHTYTETGAFTATLTITDNDGNTSVDTAIVGIKLANVAPEGAVNGPYQGIVGEYVSFSSADSVDSDGRVAGFEWDFGDGMHSTDKNPSHVYVNAGEYTITLTVTDNEELSSSVSTYATITNPATTSLVDLTPVVSRTAWSTTKFDRSIDNNPIRVGGVTYDRGIGTHALGQMVYNIDAQYNTFTTTVGIDDEVGENGSVIFKVYADGVELFNSGMMVGGQSQDVRVDVTDASQLMLLVVDGGDGMSWDHADWAIPELSTDLSLSLTYFPAVTFTNGWGYAQLNRSLDGNPITIDGDVYSMGYGLHAPAEMSFALNGQYKRFQSVVGPDDEGNDRTSVSFEVYLDGVLAYDSGVLTLADEEGIIDLDVTGVQLIELITTDADGDNYGDHADWGNPVVIR